MSSTIYQHIERLVREKTIHIIEYEFKQAPGKYAEIKDESKLYVKKVWNKEKIVNLSILKDFEIDGDSVTRLMVECANMDLQTYLKMRSNSTPLTWSDKLLLTNGIVNGLKYLHDKEIIHSELHAKNVVMYNDIPKITNIGMLQAREPHDFKYSPPEILLSQSINDKKKLNIYSLGILMWVISNDGVEPFSQRNSIQLVQLGIQIIKGARESPPKPSKKPTLDLACELDYKALIRQRELRIAFINLFALNRGRNPKELDFSHGVGIILRDDGNPKIHKITSSSPVIYLPLNHESPWTDLTNLFEIKCENKMGPKYDVVRIHVPISTVQYEAKATDEFIQNIRSALNISGENERQKALEKWFKHYGNYVVKRATLGGAITVRNWSKVSDESKSYLKSYLQWGIDYGKGASEIFEDVPLDRLPQLEASVEIETIGDLYSWFKSLYNLKFAEIISYEEFIPSYELLPQDLQQQLFKLIGSRPTEISRKQLIPNIPSQYDKQDILKWIVLNPPLILNLSDWVRNNELQCGVILQRSNLNHGKKAAFKFLQKPEISEINKVSLVFEQSQNLQYAYLLENGITLKKDDRLGLGFDKIPFSDSSMLNYPLADFKNTINQPSKSIYCQIIVRMAKISFNLADIKPLQEFTNTVNNVLQSNEPYKGLCKVFGEDYGHLLSRTFTLGGILSKKYESYTDTIYPQRFEYDINDPRTPEKIVKKLAEWNNEYQHINTSYFVSESGDLVHRNNIDKWFKELINRRSDWKVVNSEDWVPLYKILKKSRFDIDEIFSKYQIVFNGEESLQQDEQTTITIKFPGSLVDDKYHCFGAMVKRTENGSWVKIPELFVRFSYPNKNGCVADIYDNEKRNIRLNKADKKLLWFVLADPKGYCSNKNRNVKVAYGDINIMKAHSEVFLKSKNLSSNCVLITSVVSKNAFENGANFYNIRLKAWTKTKIGLELTKDQIQVNQQSVDDGFDDESSDNETDDCDSDEIEPHTRENDTLEWCILYTDGKMISEADESSKYPWSLFGDNLDPELEILGQDDIDLYESLPRISLEDAIEQHDKPNGDTLEAWKTFVYHAREGNHIAKFWIGHYLQHDILMASSFRRKFYEEVVDEFSDGTDNYLLAAMKLYKQSADAGYPEAQLKYGFGLYKGTGVNQNKNEAMKYFKLAAKNNNPTAMYNLGVSLILSGNEEEGRKWIIDAARLGQPRAIEFCKNEEINYQ
ncbi:17996_t:CDS:2 [Cetraspora pellucida]|uniref:17996_t:CDS:1 n=1 Tax=Cetraspora pellucida TaxID=1433469 RepID=A0A9N8WTN5_9GLOM|nr:17996_t:CDS:2 [Cetraspora pellucida]